MALKVHIDETSCGPLCQHPSCWQSNIRQDKGFPKLRPTSLPMPEIELDLPTVKVCNMLEDYGESPYDKYPSKFIGKPMYENNDLYSSFQKPIRTQSVKGTRAPQTSPKSGTHAEAPVSKFKVVEVQELFDPKDLSQTWDDTSLPKSYYVWVLNPKKKRRKRLSRNFPDGSNATHLKDMTEDMIPKEINNSQVTCRKKKGATFKPNLNLRSVTMSPRTTQGSSKMEFDHEGDLMSREKIREIIRHFMPTQMDRGNTNISLASSDVLQQKKLSLHEGNKNVRQLQYVETKPVFYLDHEMGDAAEDENFQQVASPYGSLKDQYPPKMDNSHEINKYKKPLPAITESVRVTSAGDGALSKIPSISLGLPALPSGIKHTKPFTYSKNTDFDFTLGSQSLPSSPRRQTPASAKGPVPTPPTSIKSSSINGSARGSPLKVSLLSQASNRSDPGSDLVESAPVKTPESLHTMSPSILTRVPKPPAVTPASYHQQTPTKHVPLLREMIGSSSVPQEWPPKDNSSSPLQIMRAPVNTPGSILPEPSGLGTIHENRSTNEDNDQTHPVSQGRSVRFEIPEVPPPPSSPQNSEDSHDAEKDHIHVTIDTVNPNSHATSSNNKPMSGATIRTDANTINTSVPPHENSFVLSNKGPFRESSMMSSPEPWPQVNEDDFNIVPAKTPETHQHQQILDTSEPAENRKELDNNKARNVKTTHEKQKVLNADSENDKDYLNMTRETSGNERSMREELRKEESPAPPPPSPEAKEDSDILYINQEKSVVMTTLIEESENEGIKHVPVNEILMTVMHVSPQGLINETREHHFQIDTFQNIDIPASLDQFKVEPEDTFNDAETERSTKTPEYTRDKTTADVAIPVLITSENKLLYESEAQVEVSNSTADAINDHDVRASAKENDSEMQEFVVPGDLSGTGESTEDKDVDGLLNSEQQDRTEDRGEHEDYKEDLRQEYEKLSKESENV